MPGQAVGVAETPSGVVCALEWRFGFANDTTVLSCYSSIGTKLYEWEVSEEFIWEPAAPLVVDGSTDVWIAYEPTGPPPDYVRYYRSKVLRFTSDGRLRSQWYVDGRPRGLAVSDDGTVYLALSDADEQEGWVGLYDAHGEQLSRWPVDGVPGGVALDRNGGVTLTVRWPTGVPDQPAQGKIVRLTSAGSLWAEWAAPPSYYGIDVDQEDNVYSLEVREGGGRVLKYSPTGELMAVGPVAPQLQPLAYLPEAVKAGP
jgi:sugar lactone lactonase YvrE